MNQNLSENPQSSPDLGKTCSRANEFAQQLPKEWPYSTNGFVNILKKYLPPKYPQHSA